MHQRHRGLRAPGAGRAAARPRREGRRLVRHEGAVEAARVGVLEKPVGVTVGVRVGRRQQRDVAGAAVGHGQQGRSPGREAGRHGGGGGRR